MFPIASLAGVQSVVDISAPAIDGDKIIITSAADCTQQGYSSTDSAADNYVPAQSVHNNSITVPVSLTTPGTYRFCFATKECADFFDVNRQFGAMPGYGPLDVEFTVEITPTFSPNTSLAGRIALTKATV